MAVILAVTGVIFLQLFWEKKLSGLNAYDIAEELVKTMDLPKGLQGTPVLHLKCYGFLRFKVTYEIMNPV